jgi:hypothetical protein
MFNSIHENTLHVFAAINFLSIPLVWAFYPETANRTLEEVDMLFASPSPFVWDAEKKFAELKAKGGLRRPPSVQQEDEEDKDQKKQEQQSVREESESIGAEKERVSITEDVSAATGSSGTAAA